MPSITTSISNNTSQLFELALLNAINNGFQIIHNPQELQITNYYANLCYESWNNSIPISHVNAIRSLIRFSPSPMRIIFHSDMNVDEDFNYNIHAFLFVLLGFDTPFDESNHTICKFNINYANGNFPDTEITKLISN